MAVKIKPYTELLQKMTEPYSKNRITSKEAYKEYKKIINIIWD